jgi:dCTP deaminase
MYLSDRDIRQAVLDKDITLSDFDEKRLQAASYDILLWNKFLILDTHSTPFIDPVKKILPKYNEVILNKDETFILHPGISILWTSLDYFWSEKYLIELSWKSSLARIWLIVHNTAGLINPWHYLNITLELCNLNSVPIVLHPHMEIAQLLFSPISSIPEKMYHQSWRYAKDNWAGFREKE